MSQSTPLDDLLAHRTAHPAGDAPDAPRNSVAIVTCMDARIDPARDFGLEPGDAHVIRTAGATVTEDVLRSLVASQWALGTRGVLLIGHSGCGMAGLDEDALHATIRDGGAEPPGFPMRSFDDVESNVRDGIGTLRAASMLHPDMQVRGFVHDLDTGALTEIV